VAEGLSLRELFREKKAAWRIGLIVGNVLDKERINALYLLLCIVF